ncbi:benzoate/H(+) symporter BenE family transporter [Desulfosporosinus sp.]|uniref:benzoate/H(+) symporter BenE family transporter n=1 Tax=Desulfosporosinus sp. TaxID=157907 RepID=UPI000E9B8EC6|nr:benzoate/H(+) symporter BenE family transporter [Desulfosporosinus sp.]MBC2722898.1 benzoate/H(+) symporter BenE family transporter [Desulfosporosinus sp.]MBC2726542.1 benzoate/H(+) symporter BenE family transporter [Desulfosporosinus sp.]HBV87426.1 benzoate transporter [Desulfosporosinus sp.]
MSSFISDLNHKNMAAGIASGLLAITGPPAIILEAASKGNFTMTQTILWMFSVYVFGGIYSIVIPMYYRMPIVGAHSITGVAFLATVTTQFTYHQLIGAYIFSGLLMLMIGYLGVFSKLLEYVPKQIISVMLAGMITKYMVSFITSFHQLPLVGGVSLVSYIIFSKGHNRIPPMVAAIGTGFVLLILTQPLNSVGLVSAFVLPTPQIPVFNLLSFLSVSVPLALLILSNDAAVGIGGLEQNEYHPPVNRVIAFSGMFSIITSFFGGQSANIAGMMTAICSDKEAGPKEARYMGAVVSGMIILLFGLFAWKLVPLIQGLPSEFVSILVGFALLGVFGNSLSVGFSKPTMKLSTAFTFVIAVSNITIYNISAPVWALVMGTFIARYVEEN